jgi:hypothetical protein
MAEKKASKKLLEDEAGVEIEFTTGQSIKALLEEFSEDIVNRLAIHGLSQKLGDSYASGDVAEAFDRCKSVYESLVEGTWTTRTPGAPRTTQLAEALAQVANVTVEAAQDKISQMDDEARKDLKAHPQIKAALASIKAKKAEEDAKKAQAAVDKGEFAPLNVAS